MANMANTPFSREGVPDLQHSAAQRKAEAQATELQLRLAVAQFASACTPSSVSELKEVLAAFDNYVFKGQTS